MVMVNDVKQMLKYLELKGNLSLESRKMVKRLFEDDWSDRWREKWYKRYYDANGGLNGFKNYLAIYGETLASVWCSLNINDKLEWSEDDLVKLSEHLIRSYLVWMDK